MKRKDLVGGIIQSIWTDDETDKIVVIVDTKKFGSQGFEATEFELVQEDDYEEDE